MKIYRSGLILAALALAYAPAGAKTVPNLGQVKQHIHNSDGAAQFEREMNGTPMPDGFGSDFAALDLTFRENLLALIMPNAQERRGYWALAGMKAWPGQPETYVVTACASSEPINPSYVAHPERHDNCSYDIDPKSTIALALVHYNGQEPPTLLARPWVEHFQAKEVPSPAHSAFVLKDDTDEWRLGDLQRLDFADYRLNSTTRAFGVRFNTQNGYSGGGAMNQAMTLFAVIDGQLRPVLTVPMYHFANYAGDWNPDGTRKHDIHESEYYLGVSHRQSNGFNQLVYWQKGRPRAGGKILRWDMAARAYR